MEISIKGLTIEGYFFNADEAFGKGIEGFEAVFKKATNGYNLPSRLYQKAQYYIDAFESGVQIDEAVGMTAKEKLQKWGKVAPMKEETKEVIADMSEYEFAGYGNDILAHSKTTVKTRFFEVEKGCLYLKPHKEELADDIFYISKDLFQKLGFSENDFAICDSDVLISESKRLNGKGFISHVKHYFNA